MLNILNSVMEHAIHEDETIFDLNSIDFVGEPVSLTKSLPSNELLMVATNSLNLGEIALVQGTLITLKEDTIKVIQGLSIKGEKIKDEEYTYGITQGLVIPIVDVTFNSNPIVNLNITC